MSGDPEQEYFVDGLVEDIITALSRLDWMFVIARNSSFTYKGRAVDVRQVGRELGVRYVLEGSVRKVSNRVRITGQLVDAVTGAHLWADRFDGSLDDVFDLQDRVSETVAGAIEPRLQRAEIERAQLKSTHDLSAYDFYLRGMAFFYQMTKESLRTAMELFSKAIECDPNYAAALAMMAECISEQKAHGWITDYERELSEGMQCHGGQLQSAKTTRQHYAWLDSHFRISVARQTLLWPCLSVPVRSIRTWPWHGAARASFRLTWVIQIEGLRA
jgi:TolB-like protein